ncbi:hypothetical protein BACCIP111895_03192 [Neobacillus rhizosphaerae]|uniref:Spore germination protein n=1 Tax=Neobacillus rhizosphaerae TaxID=2880965 RepID=A0ABM9ETM4_9BACI|nr:spore germination protein [Neobacillus rhizosphaerae]CAH2716008.1 hypothetical protein BACCIP111895_03192 [Neobacillus rhizosphaerae]
MAVNKDGISIGTVSGGIVNFGGAVTIAPISITKTITGSSPTKTSNIITPFQQSVTSLLD